MFGFFPHSATGIGVMVWKARDLRAVFMESREKMQGRQGMRVEEVMSSEGDVLQVPYLYLSKASLSCRRVMQNPVCFYASISSWQHGSSGVTQLSGSGYCIASFHLLVKPPSEKDC
jgi:hypothetical protein